MSPITYRSGSTSVPSSTRPFETTLRAGATANGSVSGRRGFSSRRTWLRVLCFTGPVVVVAAVASGCTSGTEAAAPATPVVPTSSTSTTIDDASHVTVNGISYTCEAIFGVDGGCTTGASKVFAQWKQNIPDYVNSSNLGVLGNRSQFSVQDTAYVGMAACLTSATGGSESDFDSEIARNGGDEFTHRLTLAGGSDLGATLSPAWNEARQTFCPNYAAPRGDILNDG